jgi:endonuclease/exonuclease/phosphatase family metal-dependent hydrolase
MTDTDRAPRLRLATYNIHKCQGFDRKVLPERIIGVIREIKADVICLQEVVNASGGIPHWDQANQISRSFPGYCCRFGANRPLYGGTYGNMTLTRLPSEPGQNHDITHPGHEQRGVLETELTLNRNHKIRIFNVHLGTGFRERRHQGHRLLSEVLATGHETTPRIVIGDFNEWTRGLTTRLLADSFLTAKAPHALGYGRTFPGMLPLLTLDHCYYEPPLQLEHTELWRSRAALVASDHLPLIATFRVR